MRSGAVVCHPVRAFIMKKWSSSGSVPRAGWEAQYYMCSPCCSNACLGSVAYVRFQKKKFCKRSKETWITWFKVLKLFWMVLLSSKMGGVKCFSLTRFWKSKHDHLLPEHFPGQHDVLHIRRHDHRCAPFLFCGSPITSPCGSLWHSAHSFSLFL